MRAFSWRRRLCQATFALSWLCPLAVAHGATQTGQLTAKSDMPSVPSSCADPAADIEIALVSKTGPTTGRVRITGIVRNLGSAAWAATTPSHRLQMILAQRNSDVQANGEPVEPPIAIAQLLPDQQYRIDHQINWDASKSTLYPKFIVWFSDSGQVGAYPVSYNPDCRVDNDRKEITAADINKLFVSPPSAGQPLKVQNYRLLGGVGVNTVEAILAYDRSSAAAGKIIASVAAPYSGTSDEVPIAGSSGTVNIRVHIPCDNIDASSLPLRPVVVTYRLLSSLSFPGGSNWVVSFSTEQLIPYRELCAADTSHATE